MTINIAWMSEAVCKGKTELFFAAFGESSKQRRLREAKAKRLCAKCPVLVSCKSYAADTNELGIWGGETEEERYNSGSLDHPITNKYFARRNRIKRERLLR